MLQESRPNGLMRAAEGAMLAVQEHFVRDVRLGGENSLRDGVLTVAAEQIRALATHSLIRFMELHIARPGESIRIIRILDAIQPRAKGGEGVVFPGFLGPARVTGGGDTHILTGCALLTVSALPRAQEALIDMAGPGASISPLAKENLLILEFVPAEGAPWGEYEAAIRLIALRVAAHLGEIARSTAPDRTRRVPPASSAIGLPRVGYIYNIQAQGSFKDTFIYGRSAREILPTLITPGELLDGAVVSGNYGHPSLKNSTYAHLTNPVVRELLARDGEDLAFGGIILKPEPATLEGKELTAEYAANLASLLNWQGAVVTKEGGGNADTDLFLAAERCERRGVRTVLLMAELAGPDGRTPPLLGSPPEADALVSLGNYEEPVSLPSVERVIGGDSLRLADGPVAGPLTIPIAPIFGALSPVGVGLLRARAQ